MTLTVALFACGDKAEESEKSATPSDAASPAQVEEYYAAHPDFFMFKTPADIPADLVWQNGMDEPELGSPDAKKGGTWFVRQQDFPRTLRQAGPDANGTFRRYVLDYVSVPYAKTHPNTKNFFPGLASEWAIDRDSKTVYVRINPEAKWSDGEPIDADDALFMFFFYQSDYIVAPWYKNWYSTQYVNVTKYDDLTFSITVPKAKPDFEGDVLELRPKPRHFLETMGPNYVENYQWKFEPATGPYTISDKDIRKGDSITLRRNNDWWLKDKKFFRYRYNPDKLFFKVIRDEAKFFEAFKRGDLDQYRARTAEYWYDKLPDSDPLVQNGYIAKSQFHNVLPRPLFGLYLNTAKPQLDNINVRLGIQHATNWQLVIDKFFRGDYPRKQTFVAGFGENVDPSIKARPYDIVLAMEYFAKAGFTTRGPDGILVNDAGERLSFTLTTGYERFKDILPILKEEAAKAGLELRLEVLDSTSGWKKAQEKKHDIMFTAFSPSFEIWPRFWEFFHSDNAYIDPYLPDGSINPDRKLKPQTNNFFSWGTPEMDALISQYRESEDATQKRALAFKLENMVHDIAVFVPGWDEDFYRVEHWRWMRYPDDFNVKHSEDEEEYFLFWIDEDVKKETLAAEKKGDTFPPSIKVYDKYKEE
ncbi:MAG: ABC transporter substrate-binding protein [Alphaproteobacteria bacterium]|nr:MAG: ABC transporter substrate-binding protein [Alphaproteobacteria bacterium]